MKFGPLIARKLRQGAQARARDGPSTRWSFRIAAKRMYLWRAVDHKGEILDVLAL
jgi:transposase-like protein